MQSTSEEVVGHGDLLHPHPDNDADRVSVASEEQPTGNGHAESTQDVDLEGASPDAAFLAPETVGIDYTPALEPLDAETPGTEPPPAIESADAEVESVDSPPAFESVDSGPTHADSTATAIELLTAEIARFNDRASAYEANARLMHSRIEELQQDQVRSLLKPIFERLAGVHAQACSFSIEKRASDAAVSDDFAFFAESIEDAMSIYDLESVQAAEGAQFVAQRHQAIRAVKTDRIELDFTIQRVIRQGFAFAGEPRALLPARVAVYRFQAPAVPLNDIGEPLEPAPGIETGE